jgi:hypothetical protein
MRIDFGLQKTGSLEQLTKKRPPMEDASFKTLTYMS